MNFRNLRLGVLAGAALFAVSSPAFSTTLQEMSLDAIVDSSEAIVMGEAISSRVVKTDNGVYTLTEFQVNETLSGSAPPTVTVSTPGGSYQTASGVRVGEIIAGAPQLLPGRQAVLFLERDAATGEMCVVGFSQGQMSVANGPNGIVLSGAGRSQMALGELRATIESAGSNAGSVE